MTKPADLVRTHAATLDPANDETTWLAVGQPFGLSAFEAKAHYTIGLIREMVESAGLIRQHSRHLGALFMAFDAVEVVGRCVGGFRHAKNEATHRLRMGLEYLTKISAARATPLALITTDEYVELRNFVGHGASSADRPLSFEPWTGAAILHVICEGLDTMWTDSAAMRNFARCEIWPMHEEEGDHRPVIYVGNVQAHLLAGKRPSGSLAFSGWRAEWRTASSRLRAQR